MPQEEKPTKSKEKAPAEETQKETPTNGAAAAEAKPQEKKLSPEELAKEAENKYRYLYAEFENFKKRAVKERDEFVKYGWEGLAHELLFVLDNMERALAYEKDSKNPVVQGIRMVFDQFQQTLGNRGVKKIEAVGKPFDPQFHEAVEAKASDQPKDVVLEEQLAGYTFHGRLLRPAKVIVSQGPDEKTQPIENKGK